MRFFYDGRARDWFPDGEGYGAGRGWQSVGAWFLPSPWNNRDAQAYAGRVAQWMEARPWK